MRFLGLLHPPFACAATAPLGCVYCSGLFLALTALPPPPLPPASRFPSQPRTRARAAHKPCEHAGLGVRPAKLFGFGGQRARDVGAEQGAYVACAARGGEARSEASGHESATARLPACNAQGRHAFVRTRERYGRTSLDARPLGARHESPRHESPRSSTPAAKPSTEAASTTAARISARRPDGGGPSTSS
jgi:hypothetical protein